MRGIGKIGLMASLLMVSGCAKSTLPSAAQPLTLVIATDLHYLAPELHDQGERFQRLIEESDGKLTAESESIVDQFIQEMLLKKPQTVIISGDLTLNGEKLSHQKLAQKLQQLTAAGMDVWVIPGNHDLNNSSAASFSQDQARCTESVSAAEFSAIYQNLTNRKAISQDPNSLSCLVPIAEDVVLLLLDANSEEAPGAISEPTQHWLQTQLEKIRTEKQTVISVSHQNLTEHTTLFSSGFTIQNADEIRALLRMTDVRAHFSVHMHIQHIQKQEGMTDIATSSLSVSPLQYGLITLDEDRTLHYQTQRLDDPELKAKAKQGFEQTTRRQVQRDLTDATLSVQEKAAMIELAVRMNNEIFDGTLPDNSAAILQDPAWLLWKNQAKSLFFSQYLQAMAEEALPNQNEITLNLR